MDLLCMSLVIEKRIRIWMPSGVYTMYRNRGISQYWKKNKLFIFLLKKNISCGIYIIERENMKYKKYLEEINKKHKLGFHIARFTIGYARRFTEYKRPDLILYDIEKLK